jgi:ATP-dependent DNA helicase MPH1
MSLPATQETNEDDEDEDEDENDDLPEPPNLVGTLAKQHIQVASDDLDEEVRPISRQRENRRRVVHDSDSDE